MPTSVFGYQYQNTRLTCPNCNRTFEAQIWPNIHAAEQPNQKKHILSGDLMKYKCLHCKQIFWFEYDLLYYDLENKFIVILHKKPLLVYTEQYFRSIFGAFPTYSADFRLRVVANHKNLTEKVAIFEYRLDDRVIQLLKELILRDYQEKGETPPNEIIFSGINTNFRQSTLKFNILLGEKKQVLFWGDNDYSYCANLFNKYSADFHKTGWLIVNDFFPRKFLEFAYEKYKREEYSLLVSKTKLLQKQMVLLTRLKSISLSALLNSATMDIDGVTLYLYFMSQLLLDKVSIHKDEIAEIAEEVIGFKPDVVLKVKRNIRQN